MTLTKLVNGKRVTLSPEQEAKVRAEWEANRLKKEQKAAELIEKNRKDEQDRLNAIQKLQQIGLTEDEIRSLIKSQ